MKQEYIVLKKNNDSLNSLIGKSFNQKSKQEAYKILCEIHEKSEQKSFSKALVYVIDKNEIKGVGGSSLMKDKKTGKIISDLLNNNFGDLFSKFFKPVAVTNSTATLIDETNTTDFYRCFRATSGAVYNSGSGANIQIGSGAVAPSRSDFAINTAFGTAPESVRQNLLFGSSVWVSGLGRVTTIAMALTAGGSGTIRETVLFWRWNNFGNTAQRFNLMTRDLISPTLAFNPAQNIQVDYTWQL